MKISCRIAVLALVAMLATACNADLSGPDVDPAEETPEWAMFAADGEAASSWDGTPRRRVSIQRYALVPPQCFPGCPDIARDRARGRDVLIRRRGTAINYVRVVENVTPGNVYVYVMSPFNNPEHCEFTEDRFLGVPYPCRANGPLDRLDGLDPATGFYVGTYGGHVARKARVRFRVDVVRDAPTEVIVGSGVTNAAGMMFYGGVMDKGPALPEGHPLHWAQFNTLKGGCQGPPAFGPLPCQWVHISAHAPRRHPSS